MVLLDAYFDESGKFRDRSVVSFCGVVGSPGQIDRFADDWSALLRRAGLESLTMKEALRHWEPLSVKLPAIGVEDRAKALLPFVDAIKHNFGLIIGIALDVASFTAISEQAKKQLGGNPQYAAFTRIIIELISSTRDTGFNVICDDEEETAPQVYKLYRKVRLNYPSARERIKCLSFGDDEFFMPLQAADMMASLIRLEAGRKFFGQVNNFAPLFDRLTADVLTAGVSISFADSKTLANLSASFVEFEEKYGRYGVPPLVA